MKRRNRSFECCNPRDRSCRHRGHGCPEKDKAMDQQVFYRTVKVDGSRSSTERPGPRDAPTHSFAAWPSVVVTDVSAAADAACGQLPSDCARLSWLRAQRLARP